MPNALFWTDQEDELLRSLVEQYGPKWAIIAQRFRDKNSKQCRRRWTNNLSIVAKTTEWTPEEDEKLIEAHSSLGNKWMEISRIFGDRTDNAVKNRWHALCRKNPALAHQEAPVTAVGVKLGTRTRQKLNLLGGTDDDPSYHQPKRHRSDGTGTNRSSGDLDYSQQTGGRNRGSPRLTTPFEQAASPFDTYQQDHRAGARGNTRGAAADTAARINQAAAGMRNGVLPEPSLRDLFYALGGRTASDALQGLGGSNPNNNATAGMGHAASGGLEELLNYLNAPAPLGGSGPGELTGSGRRWTRSMNGSGGNQQPGSGNMPATSGSAERRQFLAQLVQRAFSTGPDGLRGLNSSGGVAAASGGGAQAPSEPNSLLNTLGFGSWNPAFNSASFNAQGGQFLNHLLMSNVDRQSSIDRLLASFPPPRADTRVDPLGRTRGSLGTLGTAKNAWEAAAAAAIAAVDGLASADAAAAGGSGNAAPTFGAGKRGVGASTNNGTKSDRLRKTESWQVPGAGGNAAVNPDDPAGLFTPEDIDLLIEILAQGG